MKVALHSVSYAGLWGQPALSAEDTLRRAADLGFDGVLLMGKRPHCSILDMTAERCAALAALAAELGVTIVGLAGYTDFLARSAGAEVPLAEQTIAAVAELCRICADLGGSLVRVFTGYSRPDLAPAIAWAQVVAGLRESAALAEAAGVTLAVQNHHDLAVDSGAFEALLREVDHPACRAAFDAWSPALRGEDLYQAALRLGPLTVNTTVADYVLRARWQYRPDCVNYQRLDPDEAVAVPLGEGVVAYEPFWCGLVDGGFDGWVTYEMCSPLRDGNSAAVLDRYARQAVEQIRGWDAD